MIFGPPLKGNFKLLVTFVRLGLPLPFKGIRNKRSFMSIFNFIDLISLCIKHPSAKDQTFLVCDNRDLSTPEFIEEIGKALKRRVRLFHAPSFLVSVIFKVFRKRDSFQSLFGDLQVDASHVKTVLGWEPPLSSGKGLRKSFEMNNHVFRIFDVIAATLGLLILSPVLLAVFLLLLFMEGSPIFSN